MLKQQVIGLTGGIASGKSEVTKIFGELGAYIIDADEISREVVAAGSYGEKALREVFPEAFSLKGLNRRKLREIVFSDKEKLIKLNEITHGLIIREIKERIKKTDREFILVVIPLLFETNMDKYLDKVVCVVSNLSVRIDRLKKRDNIDEELALEIIRSQMGDEERVSKSDYIICNDGDLENLKQTVMEVYEKIRNKA